MDAILTIDGLSLGYLRQLCNLSSVWSIDIIYGLDLADDKAAGLSWDAGTRKATIVLNGNYHFSDRALTRAICHELLELASIETWQVYLRQSRELCSDPSKLEKADDAYRKARDRFIDSRLEAFPFFDPWDVPVPRNCIEIQGASSVHYV